MIREHVSLERGASIGIGGTNFRTAIYDGGELKGFRRQPTPWTPEAFFSTIGRQLLEAAEEGATYAAIGVPGAVFDETDKDGRPVQRLAKMKNIPGLSSGSFYPVEEIDRKSVV